jgi:Tfp pilus assembly protein PilW
VVKIYCSQRSSGFSLLELVVATFMGLLIVAVLVDQRVVAGRSQVLRAAQSQLIEDAQIAIDLLRADFMMLGYGRALQARPGSAGQASWQTSIAAPAVVACDEGFASLPEEGPATCALSGNASASSAVEIGHEVDVFSTVVGGDKKPTDCLGNSLDSVDAPDGSKVHVARNRWQVSQSGSRTELRCAGRGKTGPQPLVENVERLRLWWGLPVDAQEGSALRYVLASQVSDFSQVRAVRFCLLVRSREPVLGLDDARSYIDCNGAPATSTDARLRRAFWSTVAFRNWAS